MNVNKNLKIISATVTKIYKQNQTKKLLKIKTPISIKWKLTWKRVNEKKTVSNSDKAPWSIFLRKKKL